MIAYTVKRGDTLSQIAYRYQTTVSIIMGDNPGIRDANVVREGSRINIRTSEEFARDKANQAKKNAVNAGMEKLKAVPPSTGIVNPALAVDWEGLTLKSGQTGVATVIRAATLYELGADGKLKAVRKVDKNDRYRAYGETDAHGGLYKLGGLYVKKSDATFEAVPGELKVTDTTPGTATVVHDTAGQKAAKNTGASSDPVLPQFEMPGYRRSRMQVKKTDGSPLTMELRVLSVNSGYSNHLSPSRTNEGWAVHIGGKNLTTLTVSGFLLDTKTNREADDFLTNYRSHFAPKNSGNYFSAGLTTFLHKATEYKGLIESINVGDQSDLPLDRKFTMRFMVLSEKPLFSTSEMATVFTIDRGGASELDFFSSLKNMLTNPITGKYNTHN